MDKVARITELLEEARGLNGMVAEVACKCRLAINQIVNGEYKEHTETVKQMQSDLDKYSKRLDQIYVEFRTYGIVPKLDGMESS